MKSRLLGTAALSLCLLFPACASYTPPPPLGISQYDQVVDANFGATWEALIDYTAATYFTIESFEKDSGLMTLSFGAGDPGRFVDCGLWKFQGYNGNYAARAGGTLKSRMNIRVRPIDARRTSVRVNANYLFKYSGETWNFNTGESVTVRVTDAARGTQPERTCQPTHQAEADILAGIKRSLR